MKRIIIFVIMAATVAPFSVRAFAAEVPKINIDNVSILPYEGENTQSFISYSDGEREEIGKNYFAMFINGQIIKNANLINKNDRLLMPLRLVSETLSARVDWDEKTRKVTISDAGKIIELFIGSKTVKLDGAVPMTESEARELLKTQLIEADEKVFGTFTPSNDNPAEYPGDKEFLRNRIPNLKAASENDRFYVFPVLLDFWVDKYTGDIYRFYNGQTMTIIKWTPDIGLSYAG